MLRNRIVTQITPLLAPLLAALLASLFSVGTARAQSNDRRGLANSDRQSDFAVFSPAAHAPSPPSDLLKGNVGENASSVSVRELTIPDKAREAYNKGIRQADADDWAGSVPNFQRAIKSFRRTTKRTPAWGWRRYTYRIGTRRKLRFASASN